MGDRVLSDHLKVIAGGKWSSAPPPEPVEGGGGPPHNGDMTARVAKLEEIAEKMAERFVRVEERLTRIEAKQDEFIKHYATKADLADAKSSIIMWVVSAILLAQLLPALLKKFGL